MLLTTTNVKPINVLFPSFNFRVAVVLPHVPSAIVVFGLMLIRRGCNTDIPYQRHAAAIRKALFQGAAVLD